MKESGECATFQCYLSGYSTTQQINLRDIMGDMYNKYDKYKLVLNCLAAWNNVTNLQTSGNYSAIRLTGLNFVNSTYSAGMGSSSSAILPNYLVVNLNSQTYYDNFANNGICFKRSENPNINLIIDIGAAFNQTFIISTVSGNYSFNGNVSFSIYGLYD